MSDSKRQKHTQYELEWGQVPPGPCECGQDFVIVDGVWAVCPAQFLESVVDETKLDTEEKKP